MKKAVSCFLCFAFLFSLLPAGHAVERNDRAEAEVSTGQNLSGEYYSEIFGDDSPYQVVSVEPSETGDGFVVAYIAERDTRLVVAATDEDTGAELFRADIPAPRGENAVKVEAAPETFPEFYRVEAALSGGGKAFVYYEHTRAWRDFLSLRPDDDAFAGQVVLEYGADSDGLENFAVVRDDVKVVRVESMDDVRVTGDGAEDAALLSVLDSAAGEAYAFENVAEDGAEILSGLKRGDKLLILPSDNAEDAKIIVVENAEESASLFSGDGEPAISVTASDEQSRLEDFFSVVRIHAEVEADTGDIDTSDADADLQITLVEADEDNAELLSQKSGYKSASKSFSLQKSAYGITVRDTFTLNASVSFTVNYWALYLQSVNVTASLSASNRFNIDTNWASSYSGSWCVGTIYPGSVAGVTFSIPVYVTFYASFRGSFHYSASQWANLTVRAWYNGGFGCTTSRSAGADKTVSANGSATARLGVKANVQASLSVIPLSATVSGEAGIEASGSVRNNKFQGSLYGYVQPAFRIAWKGWNLVNKTWGMSKWWIGNTYSRAVPVTTSDFLSMDRTTLQTQIDAAEDGVAVSVESAEDFRKVAEYVNGGGITKGVRFSLELADDSLDLSGQGWTPIGTTEHPFQGEFDGNKVTLNGVTVNAQTDSGGLFGAVSGAAIHDVILNDAQITAPISGGVVGVATNGSWIYDAAVSGQIAGGDRAGGLVGELESSSLLNAASAANVTGRVAGGLVGRFMTDGAAQIANCYAVGTVSGSDSGAATGALCGLVANSQDQSGAVSYPDTGYEAPGVTYCYFLNPSGETDAQGKQIADAQSLLDDLNQWYAAYGAKNTATDNTVPEENPNDLYNRWHAVENGYPAFSEKGLVFPLRVSYVDEDGAELFETVTQYLDWAGYFKVNAPVKDGYRLQLDERDWQHDAKGVYLEGYMTPDMSADYELDSDEEGKLDVFSGLEFRFVYVKDTAYTGRASALTNAQNGDVYEIRDADDLAGLSAYAAAGGSTVGVAFEQTGDIDMKGASWTAISDFRGVYRGQDFEIRNLSGPLFGALRGAEVNGVHLTDAALNGGAGVLAATASDSAVELCAVSGTLNAPGTTSGLLIGSAENCAVKSCSASGSVQAAYAGGLLGSMNGGSTVNSYAVAETTGGQYAGGLIASVENNALVENCYAQGTATGPVAGGLVGVVRNAAVRNVYASGAAVAFGQSDGATVENVFVPDAAGYRQLTDALNAWVTAKGSGNYLVWADSEADAPVFGAAYKNWITDFTLENGKVTYVTDVSDYENVTVMIATYKQNGQMLDVRESTGNDGAFTVNAATAYALAFLFDEDFLPLSESVRAR